MDGECSPDRVFFALMKEREDVDKLTAGLLGAQLTTFGRISQRIPTLQPAELGFLRSITYLFAMYSEAGRVSVGYLLRVLGAYGLDSEGRVAAHIAHVDRLRTYLQHNLNVANPGDMETIQTCEEWLQRQCGSRLPASEEQWQLALCALLTDALAATAVFNRAVRAIEQDESRDEMLAQWRFAFERFHPPSAFDAVISEAAADMGYAHLDVVRFRKRFYDRWTEKLRSLASGYEFRTEARRLVEQSLISDAMFGMPLTGADLLAAFGVPPGPKIREGLQLAFRRFQESPIGRDDLIAHLRAAGYPHNSPDGDGVEN